MNPEDELLMRLVLDKHEQPDQRTSFEDTSMIDWNRLGSDLQLTPEQVQELQVPGPEGGLSLADRIQAMKPDLQLGPLNLSTDGRRIEGSMRF